MHRAVMAALVLLTAPEKSAARYRAITLEPKERRELVLKGLERVTGSSGGCVEEGLAPEAFETLYVAARCAGVRTSIAWLSNRSRVHVLVCAEDAARPKPALKLRKQAQGELKGFSSVTACVRGDEVHLLGWAHSPEEREKLAALAGRLGLVDEVELLGEIEGD